MGNKLDAHLLRRLESQLEEGKISPQDYAFAKSKVQNDAGRQRSEGFYSKIAIGVIALIASGIVIIGLTQKPVSDQPKSPPVVAKTSDDDRGVVTAVQYGEDWPFPFQAATLRCHTRKFGGTTRPVVTLSAGGNEIALNGVARSLQEYEDYQRYMYPRDTVTGAFLKGGRTVSKLIDTGTSLCP